MRENEGGVDGEDVWMRAQCYPAAFQILVFIHGHRK